MRFKVASPSSKSNNKSRLDFGFSLTSDFVIFSILRTGFVSISLSDDSDFSSESESSLSSLSLSELSDFAELSFLRGFPSLESSESDEYSEESLSSSEVSLEEDPDESSSSDFESAASGIPISLFFTIDPSSNKSNNSILCN